MDEILDLDTEQAHELPMYPVIDNREVQRRKVAKRPGRQMVTWCADDSTAIYWYVALVGLTVNRRQQKNICQLRLKLD